MFSLWNNSLNFNFKVHFSTEMFNRILKKNFVSLFIVKENIMVNSMKTRVRWIYKIKVYS